MQNQGKLRLFWYVCLFCSAKVEKKQVVQPVKEAVKPVVAVAKKEEVKEEEEDSDEDSEDDEEYKPQGNADEEDVEEEYI